jgi:hypothetical protein
VFAFVGGGVWGADECVRNRRSAVLLRVRVSSSRYKHSDNRENLQPFEGLTLPVSAKTCDRNDLSLLPSHRVRTFIAKRGRCAQSAETVTGRVAWLLT